MKRCIGPIAGAIVLLLPAALTAEENAAPPATDQAEQAAAEPREKKERVLTPEEKAEKEARKACKIKICDILATKEPKGDDVSCDIVKTWREDDIVKMLGGQISWPWGKAVCRSKLEMKREPLAKSMSEADYEIAMTELTVRCTLARKEDGDPYAVEVAMAPKVKFKNGKATEAQINWGEASAPLLIYPLVYAATGLDNKTNVLGPEVVKMTNEFTGKKCAEVKDELPSNKGG